MISKFYEDLVCGADDPRIFRGALEPKAVESEEKQNPDFSVRPQYWVKSELVRNRLNGISSSVIWKKPWLLAFRKISSATNQRTIIASVLSASWGVGHNAPLLLPDVDDRLASCLLANLNSLVIDFVERIKQVGTDVLYFIVKQLPIIGPEKYSKEDVDYIARRVARLTKNDACISPIWLTDYPSEKYQTNEVRLAIKAELDAYFAHLYGLSRQDIQYILDPTKEYGKEYPSVTFPGLKRDEIKEYGEYLTQRLVLEAYDKLSETRFAKA